MVSDLNQMAILKLVDKVATILINPCSNLSLGNISTFNNSPFSLPLSWIVSRRKSLAGGRALRTQGSSGSRRTSNFLELPGKLSWWCSLMLWYLQTFLSCLVNIPFTRSWFDNFKFSWSWILMVSLCGWVTKTFLSCWVTFLLMYHVHRGQ